MPTGSGKSPLIAQLASDTVTRWKGRVLCLAHRKELLQQNAEKLHFFAPDLDYGLYSAGLKSRDTQHSVIFAGIQSVYHRAEELGHFDIVIVDEAHLIPPEGEGMYQTYLQVAKAINPNLRVIGMTATPYRMKTGTICTDEGILNEVCYEAPIVPLVNQGFLTKLVSRAGAEEAEINTLGVKTIGGEFHSAELEVRATEPSVVKAAVREILNLTKKRSKVLLFCSGVSHARAVERLLANHPHMGQAATIVGETPSEKRSHLLSLYREGHIKFLVNVGVYTEGLDVPDIDCIVLLRPTQSTGLYVQMVGRGLRVAEGKKDCMILDYGGNVLRHGPIDEINISRVMRDRTQRTGEEEIVAKKCPSCSHLISAGYGTCPYCGFEFPLPDLELDREASDEEIIGDGKRKIEWCKVTNVSYELWRKSSGKPGPPTLRVNYNISFYQSISEWVCIEHEAGSYPWKKARKWWRDRVRQVGVLEGHLLPVTVAGAMDYIQRHGLKEPARIYVKFARNRDEFNRIEDFEFPLNTGELLSDINENLVEPNQDVEVPF